MFKNLFCILFSMTLFTCTTISDVFGIIDQPTQDQIGDCILQRCSSYGTVNPFSDSSICKCNTGTTIMTPVTLCPDPVTYYYGDAEGNCISVQSCDDCESNGLTDGFYTLKINNCDRLDISVNTCTNCKCQSDADCGTGTGWEDVVGKEGMQKMIESKCNCNCMTTTSYRCKAGYYGKPTNANGGCTLCPEQGGVKATSDVGTEDLKGCYIPAGSATENTLSSDAGTYYFPTKCNHN